MTKISLNNDDAFGGKESTNPEVGMIHGIDVSSHKGLREAKVGKKVKVTIHATKTGHNTFNKKHMIDMKIHKIAPMEGTPAHEKAESKAKEASEQPEPKNV